MTGIDHISLCLKRGWRVLGDYLESLTGLVHLRKLRAAESLTRRLLILMARQRDIRVAATKRKSDRPLPDFSTFKTIAAVPRFQILDPLPPIVSCIWHDPDLGEGHSLEPSCGPCAAQSASAEPASARGSEAASSAPDLKDPTHSPTLLPRIAALKAVAANPIPHAKRMARWLKASAARIIQRATPLRPGWPPGYSPNFRKREPILLDALYNAHHFACQQGP